jgi:hypothetical protein
MTRQAKQTLAHAPGTVARADGTMCSSCKRAKERAADTAGADAKEAAAMARKERESAERVAAAHRAREAVERDRAVRARRRMVRPVGLGQTGVRI